MKQMDTDELVQAPGTAFEALKSAIRQETRCALPGIVTAYDKQTQTATIKPALRERLAGGKYVELPLLSDVPVFFPGGAEKGMTFPVSPGDECLVVFSDTCIDAWYQYGGTQNPVSLRRHDLSDGFAFVGFRSRKNALSDVPDTPSFFGTKTGQDGKDGASAYELAKSEGFVGTLDDWLVSLKGTPGIDGKNGKSAYALAIENGFTGSLEDWLTSLKGADGKQGPQGPQGPKGDTGLENLSINGKPVVDGSITLTPADLGALPADATATDSAMLGGKAPAYYLPAYNLLDNSDFTNPVNQRGESNWTSDGVYAIDRWKVAAYNGAAVSLGDGGITLAPVADGRAEIIQLLAQYANMAGKTYTLAVKIGDAWVCESFVMGGQTAGVQLVPGLMLYSIPTHHLLIRADAGANAITIACVALYEGAYTAATLPPYMPKGYAAELAACRRFYQRGVYSGTFGTQYASKLKGMFPLVVSGMRIKPTLTLKEVRTQGWETITLADLSVGWNRLYGNDAYFNIFAGDNADIAGQAASICYEASADI